MARAIIHIDMDAFFAAVEQRDHQEYRGLPVVVGGATDGRGVVSTASYEARKYGVHSAMPIHEAVKLCPDCLYLPVDMAHYRAVSRQIMAIFQRFTPMVEAISVDEAFLDVTESRLLFGTAEEIGHQIKDLIREEVGLTASVGVAGNKFLAKLASDLEKPDGFCIIGDDELAQKVWPLSIKRMMGVGAKTEKLLSNLRIRTIGQLAGTDVGLLTRLLGKQGALIYELANGRDERPVVAEHMAKSVGREMTFQQDVSDYYVLETVLMELTEDVAFTLRKNHLKAKSISLKIRYHDFKSVTRMATLDDYTANFERLFAAIKQLLQANDPQGRPVRLIGLSTSHLAAEGEIVEQLGLFDLEGEDKRHERIEAVLDTLNSRYGMRTVQRARQLGKPKQGS